MERPRLARALALGMLSMVSSAGCGDKDAPPTPPGPPAYDAAADARPGGIDGPPIGMDSELLRDGAADAEPWSEPDGSTDVGAPSVDGGGVSFSLEIFPFLQRACACHVSGSTRPMLDNYAGAETYADMSNTTIQDGTMPPPQTGKLLTEAEKALFQSWIDAGRPNN